MTTVFQLSGALVMPFWAAMMFAPKWSWTHKVMRSPWVIAPAAILYAVLVLPAIAEILPAVMQPQLDSIASLLGTEAGATIAWVHFLAFDLFVGRWVYLESRERDVNPFAVAPILFLCLMLGPIGFLAWVASRGVLSRAAPMAAVAALALLAVPAVARAQSSTNATATNATAISATSPAATTPAATTPRIEVTITDIESSDGRVQCGLFVEKGWLTKPVSSHTAKIKNGKALCVFNNVKPGKYAVSSFHDANANGELDTNFMGIPNEGFSTSRNASGTFGPPSYEDAEFNYDSGVKKLSSRMVY